MSSVTVRAVAAELRGDAVGLVLHREGTLRLMRRRDGQLYAEVVGFTSETGQAFLGELGQLEDIGAEVLVCDDPAGYGAGHETIVPVRHYRREA